MSENGGRLLGMFDELSSFLTIIKLYSSRGLTDSHELAMFLELYNSNPWTRSTGTAKLMLCACSIHFWLVGFFLFLVFFPLMLICSDW